VTASQATMKKNAVREPVSDRRVMPVLVFVHIPKTGGLTLAEIIRRQYPSDSTTWMSFQKPDQVSAFLKKSPEEKADIKCVMGHFPFGFHSHLPGPSVYVTLLREPVARLISECRYIQRRPGEGPWWPPKEALKSLDAYLDYRIATRAVNVQTRLISGHFPKVGAPPPFDPLPANALDEAKRNLKEHFAVVGVTDRFDEALLLMKKRIGWAKSISYARRNAAPEPFTTDGLSPEFVARIRMHTQLDAELVAYASTLLTDAVEREGDSFQHELTKLRKRNHLSHLIMNGWKVTPLWKVRNAPGLRQARHVIGTVLDRIV